MRYCRSCILPDTRPNLIIGDDGICNACKSTQEKKHIDWERREQDFQQVVANAKQNSSGYDCLIPVSGGKDSTWQVIKCLEYGLNPLCVTWRTPARTELGQKNLDNLISLGVDHIDYSINPKVEKEFTRKAFEKTGSCAVAMHMAIFSIPRILALNYHIPLIIFGENSAFEYGNSDDATKGFQLDRNWLNRYGVTHGTSAEDWIDESLTRKRLTPYLVPEQAIEDAGILACFLGYYFPWDPVNTYEVSKAHGFQAMEGKAKVGFYEFADIDDAFLVSVHHWFKWYKFGFTRTWDNLSLEIRNGRMSRGQALEILQQIGNEEPKADIEMLCEYLGMSLQQYHEIVDQHRNKTIWQKSQGKWQINGFLLKDWQW